MGYFQKLAKKTEVYLASRKNTGILEGEEGLELLEKIIEKTVSFKSSQWEIKKDKSGINKDIYEWGYKEHTTTINSLDLDLNNNYRNSFQEFEISLYRDWTNDYIMKRYREHFSLKVYKNDTLIGSSSGRKIQKYFWQIDNKQIKKRA